MRILTPSWMLPTGLVTLTLLGCGQENPGDVSRKGIVEVIDKVSMAQLASSELSAENRVYTIERQASGITIPADYSDEAMRQDRLNALLPEIQAAASTASPLHKHSAARAAADIYSDDARYLTNRANESFSACRSDLIRLQNSADMLHTLHARLVTINGDRSTIIKALETGDLGGTYQNIDGIQQLQARAGTLKDMISQARARYEKINAEVLELNKTVQEHDKLELQLKEEAAALRGDARFDKLEQSIRAWQEARLKEAESEYNALLAEVENYQADLTDADLDAVNAVIQKLKTSIEGVQAEIRAADDQRQDAEAKQSSTAQAFSDLFRELEDRVDVLVVARYDDALAKIASAESQLTSVTPPSGVESAHDIELLTVYLEHVRIQHDYLMALEMYKTLVDSLVTNGQTILGQTIQDSLASRSAELDEAIEAVRTAAQDFSDTTAKAHLETVTASVNPESADATLVESLNTQFASLWSAMGL